MYFLLAGAMHRFHYLKVGLSSVLIFVGVKMVISDYYKIPIGASLAVVGALLSCSILASLLRKPTASPHSIRQEEEPSPVSRLPQEEPGSSNRPL